VKEPVETEIKIPVASAAQSRALLRGHGFRIIAPRIFEQNLVLDDEQQSIRARGMLLRVRGAGKTITCTFKGVAKGVRHKSRVEREFHPDNLEECLAVFAGIGYRERFRYEKYRTEFARSGEPGHVTLDETPIGNFMELEGPPRWIDATAKELGFARSSYVTLSYGRLFESWRDEHRSKRKDMRF
jgi:adenylate cyclase, class 2